MLRLFNQICVLVVICCTKLVNAQVKAELVYPIVPIKDDCHAVFDDTSRIKIIPKESFLELDKLWLTKDFCYDQLNDTIFATEFEVLFENIFGEVTAMFKVTDGHLNSEYQSSLNGMRKSVKSYSKVYLTDIKYEADGAFFQLKPYVFIIDSLVNLKIDSCWTQMPVDDNFNGYITKDSLIYLFENKLGSNNCKQEQFWPDSSAFALITIVIKQDIILTQPMIPIVALNSKKDWEKLAPMIRELKKDDIVEIDPLVYIQNDELFKSRRIRYTIVDSILPNKTIVIEYLDSLITQIRSQENPENMCLSYQKGEILSFFMIAAPISKPPSSASSSNSCLTPQMLQMIKKLESGDRLIFERIKTPDPYHKTHYNVVEPIVIYIK